MRGVFKCRNRQRIVDPFVGGASMIYAAPAGCLKVSDVNHDLVNFLNVCRDNPAYVFDSVSKLLDDPVLYLQIRASTPCDPPERAVRFLYLNRTSYGGMYRVNQRGMFNVPYGGGGRLHIGSLRDRIFSLSERLAGTTVECRDFRTQLTGLESTDLVFIDPPYRVESDDTFGRYGSKPFTVTDHKDLAGALGQITDCGAIVVATLPANPEVITGYEGWCILGVHRSARLPKGEIIVASQELNELSVAVRWSCRPRKIQSSKEAAGRDLAELLVEE